MVRQRAVRFGWSTRKHAIDNQPFRQWAMRSSNGYGPYPPPIVPGLAIPSFCHAARSWVRTPAESPQEPLGASLGAIPNPHSHAHPTHPTHHPTSKDLQAIKASGLSQILQSAAPNRPRCSREPPDPNGAFATRHGDRRLCFDVGWIKLPANPRLKMPPSEVADLRGKIPNLWIQRCMNSE